MAKDYYMVLGVSRGAGPGQIQQAYRRIAKHLHPDLACSHADADQFIEVKEAYETLADAEKRRRYDDERRRQGSSLRITRVPEIVRDRRRSYDEFAQVGSFVDEFFEAVLPGFYFRPRFRPPEKEG